ncbi:protein of unknown function (DUF1821) [Rubidibacter lacunae KORDI 51-2]|uniref:Cyclic nucleotide-binding domain-containing protein n=1 Tax=Rubidibacter lacunae KORDI 51-2 TaxID=582515 RepID=U5DPI8_9CHRO|nr:YbjN domain-containing protein [Rubidibacter lacunae]ERN42519.1 protein of unknown function (DUF1821) [Rubidibacter lacunae KORDI 51-2]
MTTQQALSADSPSAADSATAAELDPETFATHAEAIETVIYSLDQDNSAMVHRNEDGSRLWRFRYGTVEVYVQLTGETDDDLFLAWSKVMDLPANDDPRLLRKLLEMNWSATFETRFGIFNEDIVVLSNRSVADLSPGEIARAIALVASIADEHDESLQAEFGASDRAGS